MLIHKPCLTPIEVSEEVIGFINDFEKGRVELNGFYCSTCKRPVDDDAELEVVSEIA